MQSTPETRQSLLLRLRDPHDNRAWSEFSEIYEPLIYRLARNKGLQHCDAQEVTQEVLLAVARAIERWDPDPDRGSFRGWLFRITRNIMINFLAHKQRHPQAVGRTDFHRFLQQQPAPRSQESTYFDQEYQRRLFRWAAEQIRGNFHENTWRAFWDTCVEGEPIRTVAGNLCMSTGAVYVARSRVMARMRKKIEDLQQP